MLWGVVKLREARDGKGKITGVVARIILPRKNKRMQAFRHVSFRMAGGKKRSELGRENGCTLEEERKLCSATIGKEFSAMRDCLV